MVVIFFLFRTENWEGQLKKKHCNVIFMVSFFNLCQGSYELFFIHRFWILQSHGSWRLVHIFLSLVSVRLQDARLPQCQRSGAQVTKGTQVQISRITWTEGENIRYEKLSLTVDTSIAWFVYCWCLWLKKKHFYSPELSWCYCRQVFDVVAVWFCQQTN